MGYTVVKQRHIQAEISSAVPEGKKLLDGVAPVMKTEGEPAWVQLYNWKRNALNLAYRMGLIKLVMNKLDDGSYLFSFQPWFFKRWEFAMQPETVYTAFSIAYMNLTHHNYMDITFQFRDQVGYVPIEMMMAFVKACDTILKENEERIVMFSAEMTRITAEAQAVTDAAEAGEDAPKGKDQRVLH